jgi:hypothetical protein
MVTDGSKSPNASAAEVEPVRCTSSLVYERPVPRHCAGPADIRLPVSVKQDGSLAIAAVAGFALPFSAVVAQPNKVTPATIKPAIRMYVAISDLLFRGFPYPYL